MSDYIFSSESVGEGHPDKVADTISDAVLDAILAKDEMARVACETLVTTNKVVIAGEARGPERIILGADSCWLACHGFTSVDPFAAD